MSTAGKNRSILSGLVDTPETVTDTPKPAAPGADTQMQRAPERLGARLSSLSRVTAGDVKEKTHHLVDPARCRMWSRHNRRYDLLSEASCADLLEGLRSQGEQEFPAIVRAVTDSADFDYEVICGARRHWSVSFLRNVEHRQIRFLIEVRDLDDEAAFRLSDVENRARDDISDYERALDYRAAVEDFYNGVARRMAERMEVSEQWLSRFLELAKLPPAIVEAFGDIRELRENHARVLKPLLNDDQARPKVIAAAKALGADQAARVKSGEPIIDAAKVVERLKAAVAAGRGASTRATAVPAIHSSDAGAHLFSLTPKGAKRAVIELALDANATNDDFHKAFVSALADLRPGR